MDIQSVLAASFQVPTLEPDWQRDLLARLGADDPAPIGQEAGDRESAMLSHPAGRPPRMKSA